MTGPEMLRAFEEIGDEIAPMHRHGSVEEIARAVPFPAFDAAFHHR
ncbi:hypothetical protein AB0953_03640 [Streptomyces sp. NPDC046866]